MKTLLLLALLCLPADGAILIHRYDFETAGLANDTVGSAHGTLGTGSIAAGKLTTNGTNSGVTLPTAAVAGIVGPFTIETWFHAPLPAAPYSTLFAFHDGTANNFLLGVPVRGPAEGYDSSIHVRQTGARVDSLLRGNPQDTAGGAGDLRQMLVTFDGTTLTYYQNGILAPYANRLNGMGFNLSSVATQISIHGHSPFPDPRLNGSTHDFRIYQGAMGPSEVADLYALGANASNAAIAAATPRPTAPAGLANPIGNGADPAVTYANGFYYSLRTTGGDVRVRRSTTLQGIGFAPEVVVFTPNTDIKRDIWAAELHFMDGKWYVYASGNTSPSGFEPRLFALEANTPDPMGSYTYKGILGGNLPAIDASAFRYRDVNYLTWSQFDDQGQSIYIGPLDNPWTLGFPRTRISTPFEPWERNGTVNEGPYAMVREGNLFIVYSASGCWTDDYTLGLLRLNAATQAWEKTGPVFVRQAGVFGPGHNSVVEDPAGQWWNVYHANSFPDQGCGSARNIRAQRMYWDEAGSPYFGTPVPLGSVTTEDPDFLVAHFPLNETTGNHAVNLGCGDRGTLNGGATWTNPGLHFNGANSFVQGDAAIGNEVQFSLTLAAWVRPEAFVDYAGLITKGTTASPWALQLAANGAVRFSANFGLPPGSVGGGLWDSTALLTPGQWQHVAVTHDGTRLRFYINGVLDGNSPVVNLRFGVSNEPIVLGADFPGGDEYFTGRMRDARIYGRALAGTEIHTLAVNSELIDAGSTWKYDATGANHGATWAQLGFNDNAWPGGLAPLGFGSLNGQSASTVVTSVPERITTYFRRSFSVANPRQYRDLTLRLLRDDGAVVWLNGQEIHRSNMPFAPAVITASTPALAATEGADETTYFNTAMIDGRTLLTGTNVLAVEVHQSSSNSDDLGFDLSLGGTPDLPTILIPAGAIWKYRDTGISPTTSWTSRTYGDAAWSSGPAPLGYGDPMATTLSYGGNSANRHRTAWFRHSFSVADASIFDALRLELQRDDGALVYLNGTRLVRDNLPSGTITASTLATADLSGSAESEWKAYILPAQSLVTGINTLAVELHQSAPDSSDLRLDVRLSGLRQSASNYADWRASNFGSDHSNATLAGTLADSDGDGIVNLLEYAFATDPQILNPNALPKLSTVSGRPALQFKRNTLAADLTLTVEVTDSLAGPWIGIARSTSGNPFAIMVPGATILESSSGSLRNVEVRDLYAVGDPAHPQRFMRLRVSSP